MPLLSGTIASTPLTEILRTITTAKQTGYLKLKEAEQEGWLAVENGIILHARAGSASGLPALFQFVSWREAVYEFVDKEIPAELARDLAVYDPEVLITGVAFKVDEMNLLLEAVPPEDAIVCYTGAEGSAFGSVEVSPGDLGMLVLADGHRTVRDIAERLKQSPAEVARHLAKFRLAGVLEVVKGRAKSALAA